MLLLDTDCCFRSHDLLDTLSITLLRWLMMIRYRRDANIDDAEVDYV